MICIHTLKNIFYQIKLYIIIGVEAPISSIKQDSPKNKKNPTDPNLSDIQSVARPISSDKQSIAEPKVASDKSEISPIEQSYDNQHKNVSDRQV